MTKAKSASPARPVHPVANLFPMLAVDELAELAEDIKVRGLLQPIVLTSDGTILDGRNRLAACELAGVEPTFTTHDGDDPSGYALAVNLQRRNLTKGQTAMVAARAVFETNTTATSAANATGSSRSRIEYAKTVIEFAPDLADAVVAGATGLDEAYRIARERKTAADSVEAQLARLRAEDPELAAKVVEGELTLPGAWAERKARETKKRQDIEAARRAAAVLASEFLSAVSTVVTGSRFGEPDLVTKDMVASVRKGLDLLEGEL